jgi:hypothetical protein
VGEAEEETDTLAETPRGVAGFGSSCHGLTRWHNGFGLDRGTGHPLADSFED